MESQNNIRLHLKIIGLERSYSLLNDVPFWLAPVPDRIKNSNLQKLVNMKDVHVVAAALSTTRLRLRPFTLVDIPSLFDILQQPGIMDYFPNPTTPDLPRVERIVNNTLAHWQEHGYGWWALEALADPKLAGWCGLTYLPETGETEVVYLIRQELWGRGLVPEAALLSLDFGFETIGLQRIICLSHPENLRSQRVALKIGMHYVDMEYFGMHCRRFEALKSRNHLTGPGQQPTGTYPGRLLAVTGL